MTPEAPHWRLTALACLVLGAWSGAARAQSGDEEGMKLRRSPLLIEDIRKEDRKQMPIFLSGERLTGESQGQTVLEGDAMLRQADTVIRADRLEYNSNTDTARAQGHVRINRAGNVFAGPELEVEVETFKGYFERPSFELLKNGAGGEASRADFIDDKHAIVRNASYTSCRREGGGPDWVPDWVLKATALNLDLENDVGQAEGAQLRFKDVPVLPIPGFSFPLSDKRKSGFLAPSIGLGNLNGVEYSQPYYLNLAPNRDATLAALLMSRRGVDLGGEFRYLDEHYKGQIDADYMPYDRLRDRNRWGISTSHTSQLGGGFGFNLGINRVSDDNYWSDFTHVKGPLTSRLLPTEGSLTWAAGDFSARVRSLYWQTLQTTDSTIIPPYDRRPQISGRYARSELNGLEYSLDLDYTAFSADSALTGQPNGQRAFANASLSKTWASAAGYLTPRLQLLATTYNFDAPLSNNATSANRVLPSFSMDSGLVFERDASYFGRSFRQTLEPRAFYVYTPYRDQSMLPNYDSGAYDFNFGTVFSWNDYVGNDRIADNNLLTLGLNSRLLDPDTGLEQATLGIAQRVRFTPQNVTLPGQSVVPKGLSGVLLAGSINATPAWAVDGTIQVNPDTGDVVRTAVSGRYSPSNYRTFRAAYLQQSSTSSQVDIGWQWPLNDLWGDKGRDLGNGKGQGTDRWYSVGRLIYNIEDRRLVDVIAGFEYDAGCWLGRVVVTSLQSSSSTANTSIMAQIEFIGFSHLGSSPLKTLRDSIPRYQYLREKSTTPSRFTNYD